MKNQLVLASVVFLALVVQAESKEKLPVPDAAAQQKSLATIRDVYRDEYKKPDFAKQLLEKGKKTQDDTDKFVLLQEAKRMATEIPFAFEVVDVIAGEYNVSVLKMKAEVLGQASQKTRLTANQKTEIVNTSLQVVDKAIAGDDFATAKKAGRIAHQVARSTNDKELVQTVAAKGKQVGTAAKAYAEVEKAMAVLKEKPDDPAANLAVGKYKCFNKGDWDRGLPMLALGNDEALKALARKELQGAASSKEQVKLGDAWWNVSKERARYWYEKALPELRGLQKDIVEKKLASSSPSNSSTKSKWIDLLSPIDVTRDRVLGDWTKDQSGLSCVKPADSSRIASPVVVNGDYNLSVSFTRIS